VKLKAKPDGTQKLKYKVRWELFHELIQAAVRLDEQLVAIRNKRGGDKAALKMRSVLFQTIADYWPVAVNIEPKRIMASYKRSARCK